MKEDSSQSQSAQSYRLSARMQREIKLLHSDPPPGICAWPANQNLLNHLEAQIEGPEGTVYAKGIFKLQIEVPERYPFEPPNVRFVTPIYHPNIDSGGRICLDILNLPPKGAWRPSLNIATVLTSIGLLLSEPNPDDGLMCDISAEYKHNRSTYDQKARSWTQKYAVQMECQTTAMPMNISNPGSSPLSGQGSNARNDNHEQFEEAAVESVSGSPNQTSIKGKPKDGGPGSPVKSKKSLSKRLSLAKELMVQPTINPVPKGSVTDVNAKMFKEIASCSPIQGDDENRQQKLPAHPSVERNDNKYKLLQNVAIGDSSILLENVSMEPGRIVQKGIIMGKENFHSRNWNSEKPQCNVMKPLECETQIKMRENTKLRPLQNGLSRNSNQRTLPLVSDDDPQCSKLHELQPLRPIINKLPVSGQLQPERVHEKITEKRSLVDTVIISDSESDEEPVQVRSRLSLAQRTLTGKRKFRSNAQ